MPTERARGDTGAVTEVLQIAQHAEDLDRARAFYAKLLGEEPVGFFDPPGLLFFRAGSVRLLLEQDAPSALIYLKVDDVAATVETLRADGVRDRRRAAPDLHPPDDRLGPGRHRGADGLLPRLGGKHGRAGQPRPDPRTPEPLAFALSRR